jgi:PAS domain S-box-containing protein
MLEFANNQDVESILQSFLEISRELLDFSNVSIELLEDEGMLVRYAATPRQLLDLGHKLRPGEGSQLIWQAINNRKPAVLNGQSRWPNHSDSNEKYPSDTIAAVPIYHQKQVIGVITIWRTGERKSITQAEIDIAKHLARVIDLLLDNVKLSVQLKAELAERKQMEASLRESRENFQSYFHMSTVGMCVTSPDMKWIETNGHLRQMLGYTSEELDQLSWRALTHPEDVDLDLVLFNQVLSNQKDSYRVEKRFIRKDGATVYTIMYVFCSRNPDGTVQYFLSSLIDITDQKQAEAELLKLAALDERQRLARDLHDTVKQSIHSMVLFSDTLMSTLENDNIDKARQIAVRLQESARQALKETQLLLYQFQGPQVERNIDLIQELKTRLAMVERRAGIRAQILLTGSIDHIPQAWSENLFWITIEALNNALKHAQANNMQIILFASAQRVELKIIDDGIGFDLDKTHSGGMGLIIMRKRASLLHGDLEIISSPNKGACVLFKADIEA